MADKRTKKGLLRKGSTGRGKIGTRTGSGGSLRPGKLGDAHKGSKGPGGDSGHSVGGGRDIGDKADEEQEEGFGAEVLALGEEIRELLKEDGADSVTSDVAVGERLARVRKRLGYGKWMRFLNAVVGVKRMHARRLMRLAQWAPRNRRVLQRVRHLGPTKVGLLVDAPRDTVQRLLKRSAFMVPGSRQMRGLGQLSVSELRQVLRVLDGDGSEDEAVAQVEAEEVLADLLQDARGVVRWTNKLVKLSDEGAETEGVDPAVVTKVQKKLLSSLKKLEKMFGPVD